MHVKPNGYFGKAFISLHVAPLRHNEELVEHDNAVLVHFLQVKGHASSTFNPPLNVYPLKQ